MKDLVINNEKLIEQFDIDYYFEQKNYPVASALSALETTNEIQKSFFNTDIDGLTLSDHVLRLYALLQGLFVSIDSLYALAYSLTKSKNFININLNPTMRELKYIRNDVVGHPANRMYESDALAYCILDNKSITNKEFSYHIYSKDDISVKTINIEEIIKSYYTECNNYLKEIYNVSLKVKNQNSLEMLATKCLDAYQVQGNYLLLLEELEKEYLLFYPNSSPNQHRVLWRINLIKALTKYQTIDEDVLDLGHYCIGIQLVKILELLSEKKYDRSLNIRTPYLVSNFYRFLNKNKNMLSYIGNIYDIKNPKFDNSISQLRNLAYKKRINGTSKYLDLIVELKNNNEDSLVYAFASPIIEYKKKN